MTGMDAITQKGNQFISIVEAVHTTDTAGSAVSGNYIFMEMSMDMTLNALLKRTIAPAR
ncbi:SnoaL-like domain-containing protein [Spirosoma areae]